MVVCNAGRVTAGSPICELSRHKNQPSTSTGRSARIATSPCPLAASVAGVPIAKRGTGGDGAGTGYAAGGRRNGRRLSCEGVTLLAIWALRNKGLMSAISGYWTDCTLG